MFSIVVPDGFFDLEPSKYFEEQIALNRKQYGL